jgi:phospholipase C
MKTVTLSTVGLRRKLLACVAVGALTGSSISPAFAAGNDNNTTSPIKHVIIIIGENRSFDHVFATYTPANPNATVLNLLSEQIVNADGSPGPNYGAALQYSANDVKTYKLTPPKVPYSTLPPALVGGTWTPYVCQFLGYAQDSVTSCVSPKNITTAKSFENGLPDDYVQYLLTGGTGQSNKTPDMRVSYDGQNASNLPPGPYQLTNTVNPSWPYPYDAYAASPVHRFMQMQQQLDCDAAAVAKHNGWGCTSDLYPWVEVTIGAGSNGAAPPSPFTNESTGEGSASMGFYNVQNGDAPYFKSLADAYTMSDNYHQGIKGGTGANHIMIGTSDAIFFEQAGKAQEPPENPVDPTNPGTPVAPATSALAEVENPNPQSGTNNYYIQDGYGGGSGSPGAAAPSANYGGGSYVKCADPSEPGVGPEVTYLKALPNPVKPNCDPGHYYLVNNYNPGYFGNGENAYTNTDPSNYVYTIPPSSVKTIGDVLSANSISWTYFGDQWDEYLNDPFDLNPMDEYCNICNWATYSKSIMTNPAERTAHLKDTKVLYSELASGNLPAVSWVKPSGLVDGHPASSKLILFEGFVKKIVDLLQANKALWSDTAILITEDEGGGYWDSGYVQPLDFFGDGTRIPMIAVSPFSTGGNISHVYADHASPNKFIERNWSLSPVTSRSRDNLPNPTTGINPYIPGNSPAIGDLFDLFNFGG